MGETLLLSIERLKTPIGEMLIVIDAEGNLRTTDWTDHEDRMRHFLQVHYGKEGLKLESPAARTTITRAIDRYFHGDLKAIDAIPVKTGGTDSGRGSLRARSALSPAGSTISYGKLAQQIHRPKAVRAVGLANGSNPIGVVLPCHRVIGANGSLTGYGGGLERKQWLLEHESGTRRLL